jgi:outer membrane protein insertion porin family
MSYLRKKGFLFSRIKSSIEKAENKIRIVYEIDRGQKYKIQDISFEGLTYFKPDELKKQLGISEKIPFLSVIDGEKLFGLPREIEWLYQDQGFPNIRVDLNLVQKEKKLKALFFIEEGTQQKIESISFGGASLFKPEELLSRIKSYKEGPFSQPNIQRDIGELEGFYLNQGVRGTKITPRIEKKGENLFSIVFEINEGTKTKIDKVVITGNAITRRSTILRELKIKEGDDADYDLILRTKRGLEKLGVFSEVRIDEILMSEGKENVVISLKEGERNYASLGVGLETKNEPRTFEVWNNVIRPRATAEFIRSNLFGQASQLSFVTQFSLKEKRGVLSWEQPYFFGIPFQSYLNAWLERDEMTSFGYDQRGVSLTGIKSLPKNIVLLSTLRWTRTKLYFLDITESEVDRVYFPFSTTSLSESIIRDQRDDNFNPEKGHFLSAVVEWAFPFFKAESSYLKAFFKYQHYIPLFSRVNFSFTSRLGLGRGRMPIHERFFGGGSNSFRGEEFDELGPKDPVSQKPVGGKALILFIFELKFPLSSVLQDLSGAVFYDAGNIFAKRKDFDLLGLRHALGFGVRYKTPLGPLRFDLAWNLNKPERKGKPLAFITIGNVF